MLFLHDLRVEGKKLLSPFDLIPGFYKDLKSFSGQTVGIHAHVNEEFDAVFSFQSQSVFGGKGKIHCGVRRGVNQAVLWFNDKIPWANVGSEHWETGMT